MYPFNFFVPKIVKFPDTKYNKNINVFVGIGEPTLVADNLIESGHVLTHIWKTGLNNLLPKSYTPQKILLLGLGGGSNAHLVASRYPKAKITAVEIDSQMVEIAKNYFKVSRHKNLKIVIGDAEKFVSNIPRPKNHNPAYDLILMDCFVGKFIPLSLQKISFIKKLYQNSRYVLINRIWYNEHHLESVFFLKELSKHFFFLKTSTKTNVIISLI